MLKSEQASPVPCGSARYIGKLHGGAQGLRFGSPAVPANTTSKEAVLVHWWWQWKGGGGPGQAGGAAAVPA